MRISDEALIAYLRKNEKRKRYARGDGKAFSFRLEPAPDTTGRMPYKIVLSSPAWKRDRDIEACLITECLDKYNGGAKSPDRFVAKTGAHHPSERSAYFLELLHDLEDELIRGVEQHSATEAHP